MAWAVLGIIAFIVLATYCSFWWSNHRREQRERLKSGLPLKGDLTRRQEQELQSRILSAESIMRTALEPGKDLTKDLSYLSETDRTAMEKWLKGKS